MKIFCLYLTMDFKIKGTEPEWILTQLECIEVEYLDFNSNTRIGHIVCNIALSNDLINIFQLLYFNNFLIQEISPIVKYDWDDETSAVANNTSCFNYRQVEGTDILSDHALGLAIDINPMQNPWVHPILGNLPPGSSYDNESLGTINDLAVSIFKKLGFSWGGDWKDPDYQHFYKKT